MIFFDIDDTLLNHNHAEKRAAIDFLHQNNDVLKMDESEFVTQWNALSKKYFEKYVAKEISFFEQRRLRMKEIFSYAHLELTDIEADMKFEVYLQCYKSNWKPFEDVLPCLHELQGKELGIISNGDYKQQIEKLEMMKIKQYFSCIITSSEVGFSKPDIRIFQKASELSERNVQQCFYVGDRLEVDAMGSRNAGMNAIWLNRRGERTKEKISDDIVVIEDLHMLPAIV